MGSIPVIRQAASWNDLSWQAVAICERLAAVVLFAASTGVLAASIVVVWLLSRRSPLIAHRRVGFQGAPLWMLKLRTMVVDQAHLADLDLVVRSKLFAYVLLLLMTGCRVGHFRQSITRLHRKSMPAALLS